MELLGNTRTWAGRLLLERKLRKTKREPRCTSFDNVKSVAIVWDASRPEEFSVISKFFHILTEQGKKVIIFGYYPGKSLPNTLIANRMITCLKRTEVDFLYRPVTPEADKFVKERFDVLIDINFRKQFTLEYITALSLASLKVGLAGSDPVSSPFDLMISLKNTESVENFLGHVLYYLGKINSTKEKKAV